MKRKKFKYTLRGDYNSVMNALYELEDKFMAVVKTAETSFQDEDGGFEYYRTNVTAYTDNSCTCGFCDGTFGKMAKDRFGEYKVNQAIVDRKTGRTIQNGKTYTGVGEWVKADMRNAVPIMLDGKTVCWDCLEEVRCARMDERISEAIYGDFRRDEYEMSDAYRSECEMEKWEWLKAETC